jgi:hypothetical protein
MGTLLGMPNPQQAVQSTSTPMTVSASFLPPSSSSITLTPREKETGAALEQVDAAIPLPVLATEVQSA